MICSTLLPPVTLVTTTRVVVVVVVVAGAVVVVVGARVVEVVMLSLTEDKIIQIKSVAEPGSFYFGNVETNF